MLVGVGCARTAARPVPPTLTHPGPAACRVGLNLAGITDYSTDLTFADCFKASRPWFRKDGEPPAKTDARGNLLPGEAASTLCLREIGGHYPAGRYVLSYQGRGDVTLERFDVANVISRKPGRIEVYAQPADGGLWIDVRQGDQNDPVREMRLQTPGTDPADPLLPAFVARVKPFPVIRFMDWQRTNASKLEKWSDRATPADARYSTAKGVPVEVMVELANRLGAEPWFCMPHLADDEFVRAFAQQVKATLDPRLRAYVEYSNEVWNFGFEQARWAEERGKASGAPANLRFYADRSVQVFTLWEEAFGGRDRLVRVLAAQAGNPWSCGQVLKWHDAGKHADALAVAPYFGNGFGDPKAVAATKALGVDGLLAAAEKEIETTGRKHVAECVAAAKAYGLPLIAYEGGQHLVGHGGAENDDELTKLFIAANRHPRMAELYRKHLDSWRDAGGGLYVAFSSVGTPSKWGSWGMLEYADQPKAKAPKYRALMEWAGTLP